MTAAPTPGADTADLSNAVARLHHLATDPYVCNVSYADTARMRTVLDGLARVTRERDEALGRIAAAEQVQTRMAMSLPDHGPWQAWSERDRAVRDYEGDLSTALATETNPVERDALTREVEQLRAALTRVVDTLDFADSGQEYHPRAELDTDIIRLSIVNPDDIDMPTAELRVAVRALLGAADPTPPRRQTSAEILGRLKNLDADAEANPDPNPLGEPRQITTPATADDECTAEEEAHDEMCPGCRTCLHPDEPLHEVSCPSCGATIRARMADKPSRDDVVAAWLKRERDEAEELGYDNTAGAIDNLLDLYRLHADTGVPLDRHACEGPNCGCEQP